MFNNNNTTNSASQKQPHPVSRTLLSKTDLQSGLCWRKVCFGDHVCPRLNPGLWFGTTAFLPSDSHYRHATLLLSPRKVAPLLPACSWASQSCSSLPAAQQTQTQGPTNIFRQLVTWSYYSVTSYSQSCLMTWLWTVCAGKMVLGLGWSMQRRDGRIRLCVRTLEEGQRPLQKASWESRWQQQGPDCAERQLLTAGLWTGGEFESWSYRNYSASQSWTQLTALMHGCHLGCSLQCDTTSEHCRTSLPAWRE